MNIQVFSSLVVVIPLLYWLCLCNHLFLVVSGHCLDDQKSLLLQFRNNLTFIGSDSSLQSWNASHDCCSWWEVLCDKEGHVTSLDLVGKPISGGIDDSSALFSLQHLRYLILSYTDFAGAFPRSVGKLRQLYELDLSYCGFNGTIPNSLSNLTKLSHLNLPGNKFTGPITSSHFAGLHNLVHVDLSDNSLGGSIPSSLFTLPSLLELYLQQNQFTQLDEFINVTSSGLLSIDISYNNLHGRIPSYLFTLPTLRNLYLENNQFSQLDKFINVSSSTLYILDLRSNNFSGPLPTFILQLNTLSVLKLSSNKFNGSVQLSKFFYELKSLTELHLSYNNLSVNVKDTNVDPSSLTNSIFLYLASCNLKTLSGFLGNLSRLVALDVSNNQIRGIVPYWIWKTYDYLNISHNLFTELEGPLQNLTSTLYTLDLHHNKFQGPIPVLPSAMYLDYSSNKFRSFIPDSLCNALNLKVLDLSMNNIYGTIPACLMTMNENLQILNLKNNNLSGPIPDTVSISCPLWTLNLHGNLLDGSIPKSLAHCSRLEVLDFGSNQINGGFPCFLQKISTLRVLVLRNNKFHGPLRCSIANKTCEMLLEKHLGIIFKDSNTCQLFIIYIHTLSVSFFLICISFSWQKVHLDV